jgi:hypothetical protein
VVSGAPDRRPIEYDSGFTLHFAGRRATTFPAREASTGLTTTPSRALPLPFAGPVVAASRTSRSNLIRTGGAISSVR